MNSYGDGCAPLLELGEAYRRGLLVYERLRANIKGRVACHRETCGVIAEVVSRCTGDHLEIGTLYGATAILAGLVKPAGMTLAVDPLDGYYGSPVDPASGLRPSVELVRENVKKFGVEGRVVVLPEYFPCRLPFEFGWFESALIDGDHSYEGALRDWLECKRIVTRYIIFDNVDGKHPGVVEVFRQACADPEWKPVLLFDICGVVERVRTG